MSIVSNHSDTSRFLYHFGNATVLLLGAGVLLGAALFIKINRAVFGYSLGGAGIAMSAFTAYKIHKERPGTDRLYQSVLAIQTVVTLILAGWSIFALPNATFIFAGCAVQIASSLIGARKTQAARDRDVELMLRV